MVTNRQHNLFILSFKEGRLLKKLFVNLFKIIVALAIFFILLEFVSKLLTKDNDAFKRRDTLNSLPKNSVDIMFIGNSHSYTTFNPVEISNITGKTAYNSAMPSQLLDLVWFNFEIELKKQSPKVVVLETFAFQGPSQRDVFNDSNIDSMPFGITKLSAIFSIYKSSKDRFELMSGIYRQHGNWSDSELVNENFNNIVYGKKPSYIESKGFYDIDSKMTSDTVEKLKNLKPSEYVFKARVSDYNKYYFNKIYRECKKRGINLICVMAPMNKNYVEKTDYESVHRGFKALFDSVGVDFIDYNMLYDEVGIKDEDFANESNSSHHVNKYGSKKISEHFSNYLASVIKD